MNRNDRKYVVLFLLFAYLWSFSFWLISILLSVRWNIPLLQNAPLLRALLNNELSGRSAYLSLMSFLAVYGPMLGYFLVSLLNRDNRNYIRGRFHLRIPLKYIGEICLIFFAINLIPSIPLLNAANLRGLAVVGSLPFIMLFFLYQLFTSGTEEIGWRGYLLPVMLRHRSLWSASVIVGVIWALWHTPIVLYMFGAQGLTIWQMLPSFAGFVAGTIAMSALHGYYYVRTKNAFFSVIIHTIGNTFPMIFALLTGESFAVSVVVQLLLWAVIFYLSKKHKALFDEVPPTNQMSISTSSTS